MGRKKKMGHPARTGIRPVVVGGIINMVLALVKIAGGIFGNSYALIADGIESSTDILASVVLWFGLIVASREPDRNHPYGHGKAEPLAASIVALALAGAGIMIIIQSIINIQTPHELPETFTLWIIGGVVLCKEVLFRYVHGIGSHIESNALKADAWHHRSDAISSAAAFIGVALALWLGDGYEDLDDWAAIVAALVILYNAFRIMKPSLLEIMDTAPDEEIVAQIRETASAVPGVAGLDKCFVRKMGFEYYVDLHVEVESSLTVFEGHEIAHRVKERIIIAHPKVSDVLVHIEPYGVEDE